jgi:hypothetical protein
MACPLTLLDELAQHGYNDQVVESLRIAVESALSWQQIPDHAEKFASLQRLAGDVLLRGTFTSVQRRTISSCVTLLQQKWDANATVETILLVRGYLNESEETIRQDLDDEVLSIQHQCSEQGLRFNAIQAMTVDGFCYELANSRAKTVIVYTGHGTNEGILLTNADGTSGVELSIGCIKAALADGEGVLYLSCCQAAMMLALDPEDPAPLGNLVGAIVASAASDATTDRSVKQDVRRIWDLVDEREHEQANGLYVDHLSAQLFKLGYFRPLLEHRIFPLSVDLQFSGTEYGFAAIMQRVWELQRNQRQPPVETLSSSGTSSTTEDSFDDSV